MSRGIFLENSTQIETSVPSFEERYYEALRHQRLSSEIGRISLQGLEKRRRDELTSGLAEALPGVIKTNWRFEFHDGKVVADDREPIEKLLLRGLDNDVDLANYDNFYQPFLVQRTRHELDELREIEAMASGGRHFNTIVTFSPYSEEYAVSQEAKQKLVVANQKPYWQRGMLRVAHWDGDLLNLSTRSIDNSSVDLFRGVAKQTFNYDFTAENSTQMLGERIYMSIEVGRGEVLADKLVNEADKLLAKFKGGSWQQGRLPQDGKDVQAFVESQSDIMDEIFKLDEQLAKQYPDFHSYKKAFDNKLYEYVALLEQGGVASQADIAKAAISAGALARAEGRVYDMCGHILSPESAEAQIAAKTGFESLMRLLGKEVECPACEKKVVVPAKKLLEGRLACNKCGFEVDACSGKVYKKPKPKPKTPAPRFW